MSYLAPISPDIKNKGWKTVLGGKYQIHIAKPIRVGERVLYG